MSEQPEMTGQTRPDTHTNGEIPVPDVDVTPPTDVIDRVIEGTIGKALSHVNARTVFGDPVTQGDRTVIPVARAVINYGFGAGSGRTSDEENGGTGSGGGGGGRIRSNGIGYIELTPGNARFVPIVDRSTILTTFATFAGLALLLAVPRLMRQRRTRQ
jgi:uncharacterized spore protein YtfJ